MRLVLVFLSIISILSYSGCNEETNLNQSQIKSIIGEDNRVGIELNSLDLLKKELVNLVGHFKAGQKSCTGFISAKDELTTAAHCYNEETLDTVKFIRGNDIISPISIKSIYANADIIIFKIVEQNDYLKAAEFNIKYPLSLISIDSTHQKLLFEENCKIIDKLNDAYVIMHLCDTESRSSGSPIVQNGKVIGVHIGTTFDHVSNIAISYKNLNKIDLSNLDYEFECSSLNPFCDLSGKEKKTITVCGADITVSGWAYKVCKGALATSSGACMTAAVVPDPSGSLAGICATASTTSCISCWVSAGVIATLMSHCMYTAIKNL